MIVFDKRSPVYEQIIAYFLAEIASTEWKQAKRCRVGVNLLNHASEPNTVQRAFHELEVMGLDYDWKYCRVV